jgi:hypothetical protein
MNEPLFVEDYAEPVDTTTQVTRIPGTPDAPCHCGRDQCDYPWCTPPNRYSADQPPPT